MSLILKDPGGLLDYSVDWGTSYLINDSLVDSSWSVVPIETGGVTIDGSYFEPTSAQVSVSGGQAGKLYRLINHVVTSLGREDSRSILIRVEPR